MPQRLPMFMILLLALFATSPAQAVADLLPNGDFETAAGEKPEGWPSPGEAITYAVEDGNTFVRLSSSEPGKNVMLYREIMLEPGIKALELSFRVRYDNIKPGSRPWFDGRIIMNFKGMGGKKLSPAPPTPYFRGTKNEWQQRSVKFLVPEGAKLLEFMPALFQAQSGTLEFDDFKLTPLSDEEAAAMAAEKEAAAKLKAERQAIIDAQLAKPVITRELKVVGNQIVTADDGQLPGEFPGELPGEPVWLQGLSVDSMQWGMGESILWSIHVAIHEWNANVIRLAVHDTYWFGQGKNQPEGGADQYRQTVDQAVQMCAANGAHLVLDLHRFGAPKAEHAAFWQDAAERYKNHPAVLFELFNEPHGISWQLWRDGGDLRKDKHSDVNPAEVGEKPTPGDDDMAIGMQALVDTVRSTGARNIVLAGGLDWSYNLSGVVNGYELSDPDGNGIVYVWHNYPWKKNWQSNGLVVAEKHPVILTEVGAIEKWSDFPFIGPAQQYPLEGWAEDMLGLIQKHKLHWTGFSFHPRCGPMIITDWNYTPTPYWGVYVKDALQGKQFELEKMR